MLFLMRKFSLWFIGYTVLMAAVMFPLFNHDRLTGPDPLSLSFPYYMSRYIFWIVLSAMWSHEQLEKKSQGYRFLNILPIGKSTVVASKFALIFLSIGVYVAFNCIVLSIISRDPAYLHPGCDLYIFYGNLCLILTGLLYLGLFRFGFRIFGPVLLAVMIISIVGLLFVEIVLLKHIGIERQAVIAWIHSQNQILWTVVAMIIFTGLAAITARTPHIFSE